tara:strand:+ start:3115 stop:3789 length:675 start_codon:yes stop_codon:yes gene_type:complete
MQTFRALINIFIREYLITFRNFYDILSIIMFFIFGILIFVFSIGPEKEIYSKIGIGIIWTLLLLSTNLSIKKLFHDDFNDGGLILFKLSGISIEVVVIIKTLAVWIFFQLPFLAIIPISCIILNIEFSKMYLLMLTFVISSPILTNIASISSAMNLLNEKNFTIGSLIIMLLSIPVIIFSVNLINSSDELINPQMNILIGILLFFLAITPWASSACIKIALNNK